MRLHVSLEKKVTMKIFFYLAVLSLIFSCGADEEKKKVVEGTFHIEEVNIFSERHIETKNGELVSGKIYNEYFEIEVSEGKFHGKFIQYTDGIVVESGSYSNGERNGVFKSFSEGVLTSDFNYKDGKYEGRQKRWVSGVLVSDENYVNGVLNGPSFEWDYETFQLKKIRNYKDGNLFGLQMDISKFGDTLGQANLVNGNGEYMVKSEDDPTKEVISIFKNGKKDGIEKELKDGRTMKETSYKNGIMDGPQITYFDSGKEQSKKNYAKGLPNGFYTENGYNDQKIKEGNYLNGQKNGTWKEYNTDSKLQNEISFKNGLPDGLHKRWSYDGALQLEENYTNGLLNGTYKEWGGNEQSLTKECAYKNGVIVGTSKEWSFSGILIAQKEYDNGKLKKQTCWDEYGNRKKCFEPPVAEPSYPPYPEGEK